jgi:hypothetical protein
MDSNAFLCENNSGTMYRMVSLCATRIENPGPGDFEKPVCTACDHAAPPDSTYLAVLGLELQGEVLDLKNQEVPRVWV